MHVSGHAIEFHLHGIGSCESGSEFVRRKMRQIQDGAMPPFSIWTTPPWETLAEMNSIWLGHAFEQEGGVPLLQGEDQRKWDRCYKCVLPHLRTRFAIPGGHLASKALNYFLKVCCIWSVAARFICVNTEIWLFGMTVNRLWLEVCR